MRIASIAMPGTQNFFRTAHLERAAGRVARAEDAKWAWALTVLQPWASMVVAGLKPLETRNWGCLHRGRLLIHASKSERGLAAAAGHPAITRALAERGLTMEALPRGQIIGEVALDSIVSLDSVDRSDLAPFGWLVDGALVWRFSAPNQWAVPVAAHGQTGLWRFALPPATPDAVSSHLL